MSTNQVQRTTPFTNRLIRQLIEQQELSVESLKSLYRRLCKDSHPDLTGSGEDSFLQLQHEYQEAKVLLESDEVKRIQRDFNRTPLKREVIREKLFDALAHYKAAGLYSSRMRLKQHLKQRNQAIITEILYWGTLYDEEFVRVFTGFNQNYIQQLQNAEIHKRYKKGKDRMHTGFCNLLTYLEQGGWGQLRITKSYLQEAETIFSSLGNNDQLTANIAFIKWMLKEADAGKLY